MHQLESMTDFFAARVDGYDEHMLSCVEGCKEGYVKMAGLIPGKAEKLLDLGAGTGLDLDEIFKSRPDIKVTCIDLTKEMLDVLRHKHKDKDIELICGDYFKTDLGKDKYDVAISFQTMHHFAKDKKTELYKKIRDSLSCGGIYIECDYMVETQEEENLYFAENARLRREAGVDDEEYCHYDTPCTVDNQIAMLKSAGFSDVEQVFRIENTTIITAYK